MAIINFLLANEIAITHNDVVFPGQPFLLNGFSYTFNIAPKTKYWRFGIRLSKNEVINFFHLEGRRHSKPNDYIDLHLGAGTFRNNGDWAEPNILHFMQYGVPADPAPFVVSEYKETSPLKWKIEYKDGELKIDIFDAGPFAFSKIYKIDNAFKYFQIFAWADRVPFEINALLEISKIGEQSMDPSIISSFKLGSILFRIGDMFNNEVLNASDLLLLPASSDGSASSNILQRAKEMGIPFPQPNSAGSIVHYPVRYEQNLQAGYAYSVDRTKSTPEVIEKISAQLASSNSGKINIPLLGTGFGSLQPETTAEIYNKQFNGTQNGPRLIVSIIEEEVFRKLLIYFEGRITESFPIDKVDTPNVVEILAKQLKIDIGRNQYKVNEHGELTFLSLHHIDLDASKLPTLRHLEVLIISSCYVTSVENLAKLKSLKELRMPETKLKDYHFVSKLASLEVLDISFNDLSNIKYLQRLKKIKSLYLKGNRIQDLSALSELRELEILDLSNNQIDSVQGIEELENLKNLNIASNRIDSISALINQKKIEVLDISNNSIIDFEIVLQLPGLKQLKADKNPYVKSLQLTLSESDNHLSAIKSLFLRQKETGSKPVVLPAKILLLGNHSSGKSSLLEFLQSNHLKTNVKGTHVLRIDKYPRNTSLLPEAVFFDFGGQDYYHGLYRSFLSSGSVYILLWNEEHNKNEQKTDGNNIQSQNFSLQYWISQKNYIEVEKYGGQVDPLILVQSHADKDKRKSFSDVLITAEIRNEFFVSLRQTDKSKEREAKGTASRSALNYLKLYIKELIKEKQITRQEPDWYTEFLNYILNYDSKGFAPLDLVSEILPHYKRNEEDKLELLMNDLDQLHHQGLVLYYMNELPDKVWLDPSSFAKYIHDKIFGKERLKNGRVSYEDFEDVDPQVLQLLRLQKVIFLHDFGENGPEYIIPNFLPLASERNSEFDLFTFGFGQAAFTLKFKNFLPFGLVNQIICFFGTQRDRKTFWRDQLLFTLEGKAKILIQVDFNVLEIRVYISYSSQLPEMERQHIRKYIFYGVLGLYWGVDEELLFIYNDFVSFLNGEIIKEELSEGHPQLFKISEYENLFQNLACRPVDMYITLDDIHYVSYCDLCDHGESTSIISQTISSGRKLEGPSVSISVFQFQDFANRKLNRRKKVAISYSKKDLDFVLKFKDYLVPLADDELIEDPWFCTELIAGVPWNEEIKRRFNEADIIFFMVSENLMSTKYVMENEIKNAIDKYNLDKSITIVPILLVRYHFARKGKYDLSKFSALPYTLHPVKDFQDEHWAWHSISEAVRIMIERNIDPGGNDGKLTSELKEMYAKIIERKFEKIK